MRALIVYESMYGNTKHIAEAIADGVDEHLACELIEVSVAPTLIDPEVELLLVGGPTHAHGMTSPGTRSAATEQANAGVVSKGIGIREWLERLVPTRTEVATAAFDTRINAPELFTGSAAHGFEKHLQQLGFRPVAEPESFLIGMKRPQTDSLIEGELVRARAWGSEVAAAVRARELVPIG